MTIPAIKSQCAWALGVCVGVLFTGLVAGCGRNAADAALETDANGYLCRKCKAKFYTARDVFADACPNCKGPMVDQVIGFLCPADKHLTISRRGYGSVACEKCGATVSGLALPREADLKAWGAAAKKPAEVLNQ